MPRTTHDPLELLRETLEAQFQRYTDQLAELTVRGREPAGSGLDTETLAVLVAAAREGVAETAYALRRIAEGTYGSCERCAVGIPLERLEILPHARFCVRCQRIEFG